MNNDNGRVDSVSDIAHFSPGFEVYNYNQILKNLSPGFEVYGLLGSSDDRHKARSQRGGAITIKIMIIDLLALIIQNILTFLYVNNK